MSAPRRSLLAVWFCTLTLAFGAVAQARSAEGGGKRTTSGASFVQFATINAPIASRYRFGGALVVESGLDIPDAKLRAQAQALRPRVQDALRAAVADFAQTRYRPGAAPNVAVMGQVMQAAVDKVLGQPGGAKLLLVSVMVQSPR